MNLVKAFSFLKNNKKIKVKNIVKHLGIGRTYFYDILNEKKKPRKATAESIALKLKKYYNLNIDIDEYEDVNEKYLDKKIDKIIEKKFKDKIASIVLDTITEYIYEKDASKKWKEKGDSLKRRGELGKAIKCYTIAFSMNPKDEKIYELIKKTLSAYVQMNIDPFISIDYDKDFLSSENIMKQFNRIYKN